MTENDPAAQTQAGAGDTVTILPPADTAPEMIAPTRFATVPDSDDPVVWAEQCVAHNYHQPVPRYLEEHHVIPRAWQAAWRPPGEVHVIWHAETVLVCRTGHGNVHYWIERFMRAYRGSITDAVTAAMHDQESVGRAEHTTARRALELWEQLGGNLQYLIDRHQYGGIYFQGSE